MRWGVRSFIPGVCKPLLRVSPPDIRKDRALNGQSEVLVRASPLSPLVFRCGLGSQERGPDRS